MSESAKLKDLCLLSGDDATARANNRRKPANPAFRTSTAQPHIGAAAPGAQSCLPDGSGFTACQGEPVVDTEEPTPPRAALGRAKPAVTRGEASGATSGQSRAATPPCCSWSGRAGLTTRGAEECLGARLARLRSTSGQRGGSTDQAPK